jgi:hypothetical protein
MQHLLDQQGSYPARILPASLDQPLDLHIPQEWVPDTGKTVAVPATHKVPCCHEVPDIIRGILK